jgi:uncharacterized repeat protein (TIGR01451 family)
MMAGCGCGARPTETATPPIGTVAGLPEETPTLTPTLTPTPMPTSTNSSTPTPTLTPTLVPTPTMTPTPTQSTPLTILSIVGGEVMVKKAGTDTWQPATVAMTLQPGDTIKTGDYSGAEITFFEGSTVEMEASTEITVAELSIGDDGSTTIHLIQLLGRTISRVRRLAGAGSSFEITTPAAVAAVRGSTMYVTVAANGRTIVGNEHGDIRIIVDGVEYIIHEGMQRTIAPGQPPSAEMPIPPEGGFTPPPTPQARVDVAMQASPAEAHVGDVITYLYSLRNTGDLSFGNISASSNVSGNATYQSGDMDANSMLDPNETWILSSVYTVQINDYPQVVATATISATTSTGVTLVDTENATTPVLPVFITGPADGSTVNFRTTLIFGAVLDETFTEGSININGKSHAIAVAEGGFNTSEDLADGENTITVTVTNGEGQIASDTITVYLEPYAFRIELTWSTGDSTDMDLHLIRPGSVFNDPVGDCYYNLNNRNPDWGVPGVIVDNPELYQDDFAGYGPEIITLLEPYDEGVYQVKIHYYSDNGTGPSIATVRIYIFENLVAEYNKEMVVNEVWDCASISWPSGVVSVPSPE